MIAGKHFIGTEHDHGTAEVTYSTFRHKVDVTIMQIEHLMVPSEVVLVAMPDEVLVAGRGSGATGVSYDEAHRTAMKIIESGLLTVSGPTVAVFYADKNGAGWIFVGRFRPPMV